jgi:hypothetical protein
MKDLYVFGFSHRGWNEVNTDGDRKRLIDGSMTQMVGVGTSTYSPLSIRNTHR